MKRRDFLLLLSGLVPIAVPAGRVNLPVIVPRFTFGESGAEEIMPLVRINGKLGVAVKASHGPNGDIMVVLDKMIDGAVNAALAKPDNDGDQPS